MYVVMDGDLTNALVIYGIGHVNLLTFDVPRDHIVVTTSFLQPL